MAQGGRIGYQGGMMVDPRMQQSYEQNIADQETQREANLKTRGLGSMPGYESGAEKLLRESQLPQNLRDVGYESGADTALRNLKIGDPAPTEHDARIARFEAKDWDDTKPGETRMDLLNYYLQHTTGGSGSKPTQTNFAGVGADIPKVAFQSEAWSRPGANPTAVGSTDPLQIMSGLSLEEMGNLSDVDYDALEQRYENLSQSEKDSLDQQVTASIEQGHQGYLADEAKYGTKYIPEGDYNPSGFTVDPSVGRNMYQNLLTVMKHDFPNEFGKLTGNETLAELDKLMGELRGYWNQGGRVAAQEGGLMDLGGMEKDYRNNGGFVPIGGQEKADDVPARLSKNEFVFTADAVRSAGGGDIDKGAEVMENVMNNLEQGGQISEDSQGLEGARNMFATAQRLEGVM
jgi:hypothetical protein